MTQISVIIPANNEAGYIKPCLDALMAQIWPSEAGLREIIVAANGCTDDTVALVQSYQEQATAAGWTLEILDIPEGNKANALNEADAVARGPIRAYLDADVICDPDLVAALVRVLDRSDPAYASGTMRIAPAVSRITQCYARIWTRLPFMTQDVQGAGLFAVNTAGRARWGDFPAIISDDTFVRVSFKPAERHQVTPGYIWPLPEGWRNLVRVRRRQDAGMRELRALYPALMRNEAKQQLGFERVLTLALQAPISFMVYAAVKAATRLQRNTQWARGR